MKLTKAIEILTIYDPTGDDILPPDYLDAQRLGIEALKRLEQCRENHCDTSFENLPGETEE